MASERTRIEVWKPLTLAGSGLLILLLAALSPIAQGQAAGPELDGAARPQETLAEEWFIFRPRLLSPGTGRLEFFAWNLPDWLTLSPKGGVIYGYPRNADAGRYNDIYLGVSDGARFDFVGPLTVVVYSTNEPVTWLRWRAPTRNTDGSPLTDLAGFRVHQFVASPFSYRVTELMNPAATEILVGRLPDETVYFFVTALNSAGIESEYSNVISVDPRN